jgi:hypothetical protein
MLDPNVQFTVDATPLQPGHTATPYIRRLRGASNARIFAGSGSN